MITLLSIALVVALACIIQKYIGELGNALVRQASLVYSAILFLLTTIQLNFAYLSDTSRSGKNSPTRHCQLVKESCQQAQSFHICRGGQDRS